MTKTRFTPWVVLACIGTLASCTSGEGGTAGNTELNVVVPTGGGSSAPADLDIQEVEYTIACDATPPTATDFPGIDSIEPTFDPDVTINGALEVLDTPSGAVDTQDFGPNLGEVYVWQGFMDIPLEANCTVQLRARDAGREVICSDTVTFDTNGVAAGGTVKVNVLMYCGISFQAPVAMLDLDGDFSFNIANFCPDLFVLNCLNSEVGLDDAEAIGTDTLYGTGCQVRFRDGDSQCGDSCDPQTCVADSEGLTCTAAPEPMICSADSTGDAGEICTGEFMCNGLAENDGDLCTVDDDCTPLADTPAGTPLCDSVQCELPGNCVLRGPQTTVSCPPPSFRCGNPGANFRDPCDITAADAGNSDCGLPPPGTDLGGGVIVPAVCSPTAVVDCSGIPNDLEPDNLAPFDTQCVFDGDTLGNIGDLPPFPFVPGPGEGGFFIAFVFVDDDGDPRTDEVPLDPGVTMTCSATTTDGDTDCNKTKTVSVTGPGDTPCTTFGGDPACNAAGTPGESVCQVGTCNDGTCDGSSVGACCDYADAPGTTDCSAECVGDPADDCETPPGLCTAGVCTSQNCNDTGCPDTGNECTRFECQTGGSCLLVVDTGITCAGDTGICQADESCLDNCEAQGCVAGDPDCAACAEMPTNNACTDNVCTSTAGGTFSCANPEDDSNSCGPCGGGPCICSAGECISGCTVPAAFDQIAIPMACRNSFDIKAVSTFPIDLENITADDCILDGQPFNTAMDPVIALDVAFLQSAATTLCGLGTALTSAEVSVAQISVDAVAGATCTEQLSELPFVGGNCGPGPDSDADCSAPEVCDNIDGFCTINDGEEDPNNTTECINDGSCVAPEFCLNRQNPGTCKNIVQLDATVEGTCGAGGSVTINSGTRLPLPAIDLPCTAGTAGSEVQICSTGTIPLAANIDLSTDPVQTFVGVSVGGGQIEVVFQCNTSSTTAPPPGMENDIGCIFANSTGDPSTPSNQLCADAVVQGNVGEQPFPFSDCDTANGPPDPNQVCNAFGGTPDCIGTCTTVPVGVDPSDVCATFTVQ